MARDAYTSEFTMTIDNHCADPTERDRALADDLRQRIEELCADEK